MCRWQKNHMYAIHSSFCFHILHFEILCKFQVDFLKHYQNDVKEDEFDCLFIDFLDEMSMLFK